MGQIIIPSDKKVKGPWLLDNKSLEELHETLVSIEKKLEEAYNILISKTADERLEEDKKSLRTSSYEQVLQKIKGSYSFDKFDKYVLIITKQGKKIKDENLISILKGEQINEFNPSELKIHIEKGPCQFTLEVSAKFDGELETRIKVPDDNIFNDINYEINKWISQHKPNIAMQKWSSWLPWAAFPIFLMLILITPPFLKDKSELYKNHLVEESNKILKDGLTAQEITKAIELILKHESGYVPETFNPELSSNNTIGIVWLLTIVSITILLIKPKTVIGLGKNKWRVSFYRTWANVVLGFIPLSILVPFIINKLS